MNPYRLLSLLVTIVFLFSCNQHSSETNDTAASDTTSYTGIFEQPVKLVKTASIRSKVKDIETGVRTLSQVVNQYQGVVFHQTITSNQINEKELVLSDDSLLIVYTYSPTASISVRVPSENLHEFLFDVSSIGYLTDENTVDIKDKSLEFLQNKLKHENRKTIPAKTNTINNVRIKDEAADQLVANLAIDGDVRYSPVTIELYQNQIIKKEVVANHHISSYRLPFSTRIYTAMKNGIVIFETFTVMLLNLWAFILIGVVAYIVYRLYKKQTLHINSIK
jgi:hypothetical protein